MEQSLGVVSELHFWQAELRKENPEQKLHSIMSKVLKQFMHDLEELTYTYENIEHFRQSDGVVASSHGLQGVLVKK